MRTELVKKEYKKADIEFVEFRYSEVVASSDPTGDVDIGDLEDDEPLNVFYDNSSDEVFDAGGGDEPAAEAPAEEPVEGGE